MNDGLSVGDTVRTRSGRAGTVEWVGTGRHAGMVHVAIGVLCHWYQDYQLEKITEGEQS